MPQRVDWCALAILALALALRLYRIDVPFVDAHSWRQVTNADIARIWTEGPIDFFYPTVSWGGAEGRVGLEFPLLHVLIAWAWRVVGVSDSAGRLVPVAFSVLGVWWTYRLGTRLFGAPAGRAASFLMAVSPTVVYFGRTPLSDTPMLAFSVAAVLGYVAYAQTGLARYAFWGALGLALAGLVKLPAVLVLGPVIWTGLAARGLRRTLVDPWYVAAPLAAIGVVGLWYLHADQVYLETGLTQAVFRPSGTYNGELTHLGGVFKTVSHWTNRSNLTWDTAREMAVRYYTLHLTPVFALAALGGLLSRHWPWRTRSVVDIWALASFSLVAVSLQGQIFHEFHQLPTLPPLALYVGMSLAPLFDAATYARFGRASLGLMATAALALLGFGLGGFRNSGAIEHLYRPDLMNQSLIDAGWAIDAVTPKDALVVTIEYEAYGTNSPMVLYFAHRRGWSFDKTSISPALIDYLRSRSGACYLVAGEWPQVERGRPDVVDYLKAYKRIELPYTAPGYQLFDLGCPAVARP